MTSEPTVTDENARDWLQYARLWIERLADQYEREVKEQRMAVSISERGIAAMNRLADALDLERARRRTVYALTLAPAPPKLWPTLVGIYSTLRSAQQAAPAGEWEDLFNEGPTWRLRDADKSVIGWVTKLPLHGV